MRALAPLLLAIAPLALAAGPEFDVASIKAYVPPSNGMILIGPGRGGPGTADPTHITWSGATVRDIIMTGWDIRNYQVTGPDAINSERWDIAAVIPEGATRDQVRDMWKNLLETRFGMKWRLEQKEFQVDELHVGPKGHKLTLSEDQNPPPPPSPADAPPAPPTFDKDGRPQIKGPGMMMMINRGPTGLTAKATAKQQPMAELVKMISNQIGHPVVDKTGLTGKYDFFIEYFPTNLQGPGSPMLAAPPPPARPAADASPDLGLDFDTAIQQQLGLRLVKGKGMLDVVVVEKVSKPSEN